jgi:ketosteroid isomerase-like protein
MTTRETVQGYFTALKERRGWDSFLSDDLAFTSFTSPVKHVAGKNSFLEATKRFYTSYLSFEVRNIIVEGERACALTSYELKAPGGNTFTSDVAEIFTVKGDKISSFDIYFDSAPFPK